jgi:hypothetical protein
MWGLPNFNECVTQDTFVGVKSPGHEPDYSCPSIVEVNMSGAVRPAPVFPYGVHKSVLHFYLYLFCGPR